MKPLHRAARVERPIHRPSFSGFLLLTLLLFPLAAHAQSGSSPFDTGLTSIQTLFTGTIAKVSSLIAIVLGGYRPPAPEAWAATNLGYGEVESKRRFPLLHTPDGGYLNSKEAALH